MFPKLQDVINEVNNEYFTNFIITSENRTSDLQKVVNFIDKYCYENNVTFVYGRGKRKSRHQKLYEITRKFLDRQLLYDLHKSRFEGRNSYSKTDTFIKVCQKSEIA